MDFLRNTPKLETLIFRNFSKGKCTDLRFKLVMNTITLEPLKLNTLRRFEIADDILTEDCVRKIGEWFPNLSHFAAVLDDTLLWAVYKFLNNSVETLEVTGKMITDAGITGITKVAGEQIILGPSIGQMKKLRRLNIDEGMFSNPTASVRLTDNAVHNGFMLLTELNYLKIFITEDSITEQAYEELCDRRNISTLLTRVINLYQGHEIQKTRRYQVQEFIKMQ